MTLVERYILRTAAIAFVACLGGLTAVIWLSQALREFDLLTTKGQSLLIFLMVTGLTIPSLVMLIAPFALFAAVLYTLNKLNGDSELIVMSAAGCSPARLLRPFAVLAVLVTLLVGFISLVVMPWSFREIRDLVTKIRADFLTRVVREGQFTTLDQGFIFHYRERGPAGELRGIFMQDRRDPARISTYIAETGQTAEAEGQNFLVLDEGSVQRQQPGDRDPAVVVFKRYAIDLAQFAAAGDEALKPRERTTAELFAGESPGDTERNREYMKRFQSRFRAELHDRFVNPLYALAAALIAFAALGQARTTRQGRGLAMGLAVIVFGLIRMAGVGASTMVARTDWAIVLVYGVPLLTMAGGLYAIFGPPLPRPDASGVRKQLATLAAAARRRAPRGAAG